MSLTLIDRFHPRMRNEQQEAINAGRLYKLEEIELLQPEQLRPLALLSLLLLLIGGVFFGLLTFVAYSRQAHPGIAGWGLLLWLLINIVGYMLILPLHEVIHAAAFTLWGGKPYFGTRLPYALYCGAKEQLFRRNQYLVVGLAPLIVITLAGILFTLVSPALASYTIFATAGNISGSAGDVWAVRRLLRLPPSVLVEDTEAGYRAWQLSPLLAHDTMPAQ